MGWGGSSRDSGKNTRVEITAFLLILLRLDQGGVKKRRKECSSGLSNWADSASFVELKKASGRTVLNAEAEVPVILQGEVSSRSLTIELTGEANTENKVRSHSV